MIWKERLNKYIWWGKLKMLVSYFIGYGDSRKRETLIYYKGDESVSKYFS